MAKTHPAFKNIIPAPVEMTPTGEFFEIRATTPIYTEAETRPLGQELAATLYQWTGLQLAVKENPAEPQAEGIFVQRTDSQPTGREAYTLEITATTLKLAASQPAGVFYGIQTILQLVLQQNIPADRIQIPTGTIQDSPRFGYRGVMLDVSRHFFGVEDVKHYIDLLAFYKINILHLHLSDDQGWRIEIKSWPNLTAHGSKTQVGGGEGGYFTQADFTEIVTYAQQRFMTIVPEIDLPGHTNAALASYPELNKDGKAPELYTGTKVGFSSLCLEKEKTIPFIDDVIGELAALTPGPYLHIGGDEAQSTSKADYDEFIRQIQAIVQKHGKTMIGWDEILKTDLQPGTIAQYWRFNQKDFEPQAGVQLVLSPANRAYIDMKYDSNTPLGLSWAGTVSVKDSYLWEPAELLPGVTEADILGVEAPLWSETVEKMADIEFMTFPRLPGIAEIGWSPRQEKNWETYRARLAAHGPILSTLGVNFFRSPQIDWR